MRAGQALILVSLGGFLSLAGCADGAKEGPTEQEIAHMVGRYHGAITGVLLYNTGKPVYNYRVYLQELQGDEVVGKVETLHDGRFFFQRLPGPKMYKVDPMLKDWDECKVQVYPGKFSNLTIQQPYWEGTTRKGGCIPKP